jgi:predicted methyltransferase
VQTVGCFKAIEKVTSLISDFFLILSDFNQNWNVYTDYALKPTNTFYHINYVIKTFHTCAFVGFIT